MARTGPPHLEPSDPAIYMPLEDFAKFSSRKLVDFHQEDGRSAACHPCQAVSESFVPHRHVVVTNNRRGMTAGRAPSWEAYARNLGHELNRRRHAAGLSQERLAHAAGLTRYHYQQLEKGESRPGTPANPSMRMVLAIAQVLEVPIEELLPDGVPDLTAGR